MVRVMLLICSHDESISVRFFACGRLWPCGRFIDPKNFIIFTEVVALLRKSCFDFQNFINIEKRPQKRPQEMRAYMVRLGRMWPFLLHHN